MATDPTLTLRVPEVAPPRPSAGEAAGALGRLTAEGSRPWVLVAAIASVVVLVGGGIAWARRGGSDTAPRTAAERRHDGGVGGEPGSDPSTGGGDRGGGGDERSPERYCEVLESEMAQLQQRYEAEQGAIDSTEPGLEDVLGMFTLVAGIPSDIASIFEKAERVAPEEIAVETGELAAGFRDIAKQMGSTAGDAISDPFTALFGGALTALIQGAQLQRPMDAVDAYTRRHCELGS